MYRNMRNPMLVKNNKKSIAKQNGDNSDKSDSDNDDTVVCYKNYRSYMCKPVCSSGSDSDVTDCNHSNLEYKLYQTVLQTFGRDPT